MNESSGSLLNDQASARGSAIHSAMVLEFPDWSGHRSPSPRLNTDEMLRYCEAIIAQVRRSPGGRQQRAERRCTVEFAL